MADLKNRSRSENGFSRRLNKIFVKHRKEAADIMGMPAEPSRLSSDYWERLESEVRGELEKTLPTTYKRSWAQHLPESMRKMKTFKEKGDGLAVEYGKRKSRELASRFVQHTKERLARIKDIPRPDGFMEKGSEYQKELRGSLRSALGQARGNRIAVSETTAAVTEASERVVLETVGWSENDTWFTKSDDRVCPTCAPLHRNKRSEWAKSHPAGPPAHVNCRCWIDYETKKRGDKTGKQAFLDLGR